MAPPHRTQQTGWFALLCLLAAWAVARLIGWL